MKSMYAKITFWNETSQRLNDLWCGWTTKVLCQWLECLQLNHSDISSVWYNDRTMPFVVKCCPVMKRRNCCCSCDLPTAAVIVGWIYLVCHPILVFFSQNVLLSRKENVISYFRHGLIQCFPTICTLELFGIGKSQTQG